VGGCKNLDIQARCLFNIPRQIERNELSKDLRYELQALCPSDDGGAIATVARLTVSAARAADLEKHYRVHAQVPCRCLIVRPPCNPDMTSITLDVDPPPFARVER
jgi:hypothetical protein